MPETISTPKNENQPASPANEETYRHTRLTLSLARDEVCDAYENATDASRET